MKILSRKIIALIILRRRKMKKRFQEYWVHHILSDKLLSGKFYTMHSKLLDYPKKIFAFYRMSITTFNELVKLIGPAVAKKNTNLRLSMLVDERFSVTIR